MMGDTTPKPPSTSIFSSLSLSRRAKPPNEPLAHPLLGASSSSVNLAAAEPTDFGPSPAITHSRQSSWNAKSPGESTGSLPYKPRQRHGGGMGSTSSTGSFFATTAASPTLAPTTAVSTSPVTPTAGVLAAPTTSTSTSFVLPPAAGDLSVTNGELSQSTILSPALSGSATTRLQLQSLKAAAQGIGLGNGSMGMAMIDAVFDKAQLGKGKLADGGDWAEVLKVLMGGKAILLLPVVPASSLPVTPQILRDHIAFIAPPLNLPDNNVSSETSRVVSVIVTLSGIVGTMVNANIVFDSVLPIDSPFLTSLRDAAVRPALLSSLRPTHPSSCSTTSTYPSFSVSEQATTLSFPPPGKGNSETDKVETSKVAAGKLGRINPFASFFGGAGTSPNPGSSPSKGSAGASLTTDRPLSPSKPSSSSTSSPSLPQLPLPQADIGDAASTHSNNESKAEEGFHVTAYTVSKPIRLAEVHKSATKATRSHIRDELSRLPDKVVEKVFRLVISGVCPSSVVPGSEGKQDEKETIIDFADPTASGERVQEFMEGVYDDLVLHHRADSSHLFADGSIRKKASGSLIRRSSKSDAKKEPTEEEAEEERKARRALREEAVEREASEETERVEALVCRLLYNRIFSPIEADDGRHDEALASRIAALNMLDLTLDHLGLITQPEDEQVAGQIATGLAAVVDRVGSELQRLSSPTCLTPKEKADVLIAAHKLVVDGLADLPSIDLRPEGEPYKPTSRTSSRNASRPASPSCYGDQLPSNIQPRSSTPPSLVSNVHDDAQHVTPRPPLVTHNSSGSTRLSRVSSTETDPLSVSLQMDRTPTPFEPTPDQPVPSLSLTESAAPTDIEQAMADSVLTLHAEPLSRETSASAVPPSKPPKQSTSGADLILPIIIFAVVKSNPAQLASQLMYLRRYRSAICLTGEASYAIVNLTAVVEFLEHVGLAELGLGDESDKVISVEDLSPIGLSYLDDSNADAASIASSASRLRGRVFQVGELAAGSANKVISGVMDTSWTALRGLIATTNPALLSIDPSSTERPTLSARQASGFSLAHVTASVANIAAATTAAARSRSRATSRASAVDPPAQHGADWMGNQELADISSRPESIREKEEYPSPSDSEDELADIQEDREEDAGGGDEMSRERSKSDVRSIKSVSSVLSASKREREKEKGKEGERSSLSNRLASIGGSKPAGFLANFTSGRTVPTSSTTIPSEHQSHRRRSSLLAGSHGSPLAESADSLPGPPAETVIVDLIEPPIERFMTCEVGDIRLSEMIELLRDYRRLGQAINNQNARYATQSPS